MHDRLTERIAIIYPLSHATIGARDLEISGQSCVASRPHATALQRSGERVMAVDSFNTRTGAVVSAGSDYGWSVNGNDTNFALTGRVGIGTTSPARVLHVASGTTALA